MSGYMYWCDRKIPIRQGESLAYALQRESNAGCGSSPTGQIYGLFCGIGACQGCLVDIEGRGVTTACLTMPYDGMRVRPVQNATVDGNDN